MFKDDSTITKINYFPVKHRQQFLTCSDTSIS